MDEMVGQMPKNEGGGPPECAPDREMTEPRGDTGVITSRAG